MNNSAQIQNTPANPPPVIRTPFLVTEGKFSWSVGVEPDGHGKGDTRYYFNHPTESVINKNTGKRRARKITSQSRQEIEDLLRAALKNMVSNKVTLTREQFHKLQDDQNRLNRMIADLEGTGLSPELLVGQTVPTLRLILPEAVTLCQALECGRAFFVPALPKTVDEIIDELIPLIRKNSTERYADNLLRHCEPIRKRFSGQYIHQIWPIQRLEQLLGDTETGKFLSETEKKKILSRNKGFLPKTALGEEKWYSDKSIVHHYNAWRRVFIRAKAIGAWPALRPVPTELMEKPKADLPELDALSPSDWVLLLPALTADELRYVALLLADIRSAEIERLGPKHLVLNAQRIPITITVPGISTKGKKGKKKPRNVAIVPYVSVLLYLTMPEGDRLLSREVKDIQESIFKKGRELGIEMEHNCLRRMHDTYFYALLNAFDAVSKDSSHSKKISEDVYRGAASLEDALAVYSTFRPPTPTHLKKWVNDWLEPIRKKFRGGEIVSPLGEDDELLGVEPTIDLTNSAFAKSEPVTDTISVESVGKTNTENPVDGISTNDVVPPAPRRPDGKIAWQQISSEELLHLRKKFTITQIATAWGVSVPAISQRYTQRGLGRQDDDNSATLTQDTKEIGETGNMCDTGDTESSHDKPAPRSMPAEQATIAETQSQKSPKKPDPYNYIPESPPAQPPRKSNGKIDWAAIPTPWLANLIDDYPGTQIAKAWGITLTPLREFAQTRGLRLTRGKWQKKAGEQWRQNQVKNEKPKRVWPWENPSQFLRDMCELGAKTISQQHQCDPTILYDHAGKLGLPKRSHRRFKKEGKIPGEVLELIAKYDAEATSKATETPSAANAPLDPRPNLLNETETENSAQNPDERLAA